MFGNVQTSDQHALHKNACLKIERPFRQEYRNAHKSFEMSCWNRLFVWPFYEYHPNENECKVLLWLSPINSQPNQSSDGWIRNGCISCFLKVFLFQFFVEDVVCSFHAYSIRYFVLSNKVYSQGEYCRELKSLCLQALSTCVHFCFPFKIWEFTSR